MNCVLVLVNKETDSFLLCVDLRRWKFRSDCKGLQMYEWFDQRMLRRRIKKTSKSTIVGTAGMRSAMCMSRRFTIIDRPFWVLCMNFFKKKHPKIPLRPPVTLDGIIWASEFYRSWRSGDPSCLCSSFFPSVRSSNLDIVVCAYPSLLWKLHLNSQDGK